MWHLPVGESAPGVVSPLHCLALDAELKPWLIRCRYKCGHSHCCVCIRMWLENSFKCPQCVTTMNGPPFRHYAEENDLELHYPGCDNNTSVAYDWDDLLFPKKFRVIVPESDSE